VAIAAMAANLLATLLLMRPLAHVGVAIALSLAGWLQALLLSVLLSRRGHFRLDRRARGMLPRIVAATRAWARPVLLRLLLTRRSPARGDTAPRPRRARRPCSPSLPCSRWCCASPTGASCAAASAVGSGSVC
jgi:hypothetical protein